MSEIDHLARGLNTLRQAAGNERTTVHVVIDGRDATALLARIRELENKNGTMESAINSWKFEEALWISERANLSKRIDILGRERGE